MNINEKISRISDLIGLPVDEEIIDTKKAILNLRGFKPVRLKASLEVLKNRGEIEYLKIAQVKEGVFIQF